MSKLRIVFVGHAGKRARERHIELSWVERLLRMADRIEPDPRRPGRLRVFGYVPELSQMPRVVVDPGGEDNWEVVTLFPDRRATKRRTR